MMQKVLVLAGPTAVGKTELSLRLAELFDCEIISGDSIQIYRGFDIGSAKATEAERARVQHYLIDEKEPGDRYSVAEFQQRARACIEDIASRNKLPFIVGGTGLYIRACLYDYDFPEEEGQDDPLNEYSNEELYRRLQEVDPLSAEKIHPNNRKRLVRAYNVYLKEGKTMSERIASQTHEPVYDIKIIGLTLDRQELYQRVHIRMQQMLEDGLIEEIRGLLDSGVTFRDQAMQGIGYKEFEAYFNGTSTLEECLAEAEKHTRQFIKRQYTWFNHQLPVSWHDPKEKEEIIEEIRQWLKN